MSTAPAPKSAKQKLDEIMQRVRELPPGGDLGSLIERELSELARAAEEEILAERKKAEETRQNQAGFPPSA